MSLAGWPVVHLRRSDHLFPLRHPACWLIPGAVPLLAGGSLVLLRGAYFANRGILDQPGDRLMARRLLTCGSFQYSQNPMSLGAVVLSPGLGLFLLSPSILLFAALLFLFCHVLAVSVEEPKLGNGFGQTYRA